MPKTIAITPSWYWPTSVDRVAGIPPYSINELCVDRHLRTRSDAIAVTSSDQQLSFGELHKEIQNAAKKLESEADGSARIALRADLSLENLILLLGSQQANLLGELSPAPSPWEGSPTPDLKSPALAISGRRNKTITHSQRSMLAMIISVTTFLQPSPDRAWLASLSLDRWEGLVSALIPLYLGEPLIICENADSDSLLDAIITHRPGYAMLDLDDAAKATRESRWGIRKARDIVETMLLCTQGSFDPASRQRVGKSLRSTALTLYGLPETGPVFASHPEWYLDESVGIPLTNAHVVPADPRTGTPIQTLWELVESAEVTVKGPMLMCGQDDEDHSVEGRYRTGVIASSDANGMIYLLPE